MSEQEQLLLAHQLMDKLFEQLDAGERIMGQYVEQIRILKQIIQIQKDSIAYLDNMLSKSESVHGRRLKIVKQQKAKLEKELNQLKNYPTE